MLLYTNRIVFHFCNVAGKIEKVFHCFKFLIKVHDSQNTLKSALLYFFYVQLVSIFVNNV